MAVWGVEFINSAVGEQVHLFEDVDFGLIMIWVYI